MQPHPRRTTYSERSSQPIRILFAGGCHVGGFPVGEDLGFVQAAMEDLRATFRSQSFESRALMYINLSSKARVARECRDFKPDILVLQLGHHESLLPIKKRIAQLIQPAKHSFSRDIAPIDTNYEPKPELHFSPKWSSPLKNAAKLCLDIVLRITGHPMMDCAHVQRRLNNLLTEMQALGIRHILLLSPFPCKDLVTGAYRRKEHAVFCNEAIHHHCQFIDIAETALDSKTGVESLYADKIHLSAEGHRAVGLLLASKICDVLLNEGLLAAPGFVATSCSQSAHAEHTTC